MSWTSTSSLNALAKAPLTKIAQSACIEAISITYDAIKSLWNEYPSDASRHLDHARTYLPSSGDLPLDTAVLPVA